MAKRPQRIVTAYPLSWRLITPDEWIELFCEMGRGYRYGEVAHLKDVPTADGVRMYAEYYRGGLP